VPGSAEARLGEAEALLDAGEVAAALGRLEPLLAAGAEGPDAWTLAAAAVRAAGSPADARLLAVRARERAAGGWIAAHRAVRLAALEEGLR
jgi:thioredoxin-like negative regulator of GroEL